MLTQMIVVTGREFRANQSKYVGYALKGEDVIVKARYGTWRIVPLSEDDIVINKRDLSSELKSALMETKEAKMGKRKLNSLHSLIDEIRDSGK